MAKRSPNQTDKFVGNRIRMQRMVLGKSQEWLDKMLGLTFQQIQKYEKGSNRVGAGRLQELSYVLGVPIDFFFDGAPPPRQASGSYEPNPLSEHMAEFMASSEGVRIAAAFAQINDRGLRRAVVEMIEEFVRSAKKKL